MRVWLTLLGGALTLLSPTAAFSISSCEELRRDCMDYCRYTNPYLEHRDCKRECRDRVKTCRMGGRSPFPGAYGRADQEPSFDGMPNVGHYMEDPGYGGYGMPPGGGYGYPGYPGGQYAPRGYPPGQYPQQGYPPQAAGAPPAAASATTPQQQPSAAAPASTPPPSAAQAPAQPQAPRYPGYPAGPYGGYPPGAYGPGGYPPYGWR